MSAIYHKAFKVPTWVVVDKVELQDKIVQWFQNHDALLQEWPANTFQETIESYKNKGWKEYLVKGQPLNTQLVMTAAAEHMKKSVNVVSHLVFTTPITQINRVVKEDGDYARILNDILNAQPAIMLSQVFQVAERSYKDGNGNYLVWVTPAPCDLKAIHTISNKVIRIGEDSGCDINVKDVTAKKLNKFLEDSIQALLQ